MNTNLFQQAMPGFPPLALRPKEAAESLGISERLLLDWTQQHGLPCVRIGRVVLYPVDLTREWLRSMSTQSQVHARHDSALDQYGCERTDSVLTVNHLS